MRRLALVPAGLACSAIRLGPLGLSQSALARLPGRAQISGASPFSLHLG